MLHTDAMQQMHSLGERTAVDRAAMAPPWEAELFSLNTMIEQVQVSTSTDKKDRMGICHQR
jgi:hypothetical protein